ncbi:MAG: hypothetical protein KDD58_11880 [Bdellovibrionales bacterium]|nr:hypothetical protein [Bdellovibrionales bacterium]
MKKCALLTCDDLTGYVSDEDPLAEAIESQLGFICQWIPWSQSINWSEFDYAIIRTTWDYTLKRDLYLQTLKKIVQSGVELFNPFSIVEWNSHKSYLLDLLKKKLNVIESLDINKYSEQELLERVSNWSQKQIIAKPFVGATSQGLKIFNKDLQGINQLFHYIKNPQNWFLQPFYEEIFEGEMSLIYFNNKFSHGLKKIPKNGDFRSQEEFGSEIKAYEPSKLEIDFGLKILSTVTEPLLYARVDYVLVNQHPLLMELELIEPALYFRTHPQALNNFVLAIKKQFC